MAQQSSAQLAAQFGGKPVEALAAEFGGKPVETPAQTTPAPTSRPTILRDPMQDLGMGAAKGLARTAIGAAQLVNRGMSAVGLSQPIKPEVFSAARETFTTPASTAESVGLGAEQIAEFLVPFGIGAKAKGLIKGGSLVTRGARGLLGAGGEAAEMGAKAAVQTGGDAESVITAALIGSATPTVARLVAGAAKAVTRTFPEALYQRVFKLAHDDVARSVAAEAKGAVPNPTLAREVLDRGLRGDARNMAVYTVKKLHGYEADLKQHLAGKQIQLPQKADYITLLDDIGDQFGGAFSDIGKQAKALSTKLKLFGRGNAVNADDALALKRLLDQSRASSSFRLSPTLSPKQDQFKTAADLVRRQLHLDKTTSTLLDEERIMIEARDALIDDMVKQGNRQLVDMVDRLMVLPAAAMPFLTPAALATAGGVRALRSPFVLTSIGQGFHKLGLFTPGQRGATNIMRAGAQLATGGGSR